jgi:tetratricopeptide (TPR) repeat protein
LRRIDELNAAAEPNQRVEVWTLLTRSRLEAMRGRFDEARDLAARAIALTEEQGLRGANDFQTGVAAGVVELLAGDPIAAERELRPACEGTERIGELSYLSSMAPHLVEALYQQGRHEEALLLTEQWRPERLTVPEDTDAHVKWRSVRAKLLARTGELDEAERVAREATTLAARTDYLNLHAQSLADLAEVLRLAGRPHESAATLEQASELFEEKGNLAAAKRLRALLAETASTT